jgi:hypothetical protein
MRSLESVLANWHDKTGELGFSCFPHALLMLNAYDRAGIPKLTPAELVVLLILIASRQEKGYGDRFSTRELAARANISRRQVFRVLRSLRAKRYVKLDGMHYELAQCVDRIETVSQWALRNDMRVAPNGS